MKRMNRLMAYLLCSVLAMSGSTVSAKAATLDLKKAMSCGAAVSCVTARGCINKISPKKISNTVDKCLTGKCDMKDLAQLCTGESCNKPANSATDSKGDKQCGTYCGEDTGKASCGKADNCTSECDSTDCTSEQCNGETDCTPCGAQSAAPQCSGTDCDNENTEDSALNGTNYQGGHDSNTQNIIVSQNNTDIFDILTKFGFKIGMPSNNGSNKNDAQSKPQNEAQNDTAPIDVQKEDTQKNNSSSEDKTGNAQLSEYEKEVAAIVNRYRAQYGLKPVTVNLELSNVARIKAQDMKQNRYFSHNSPTYGSPFDMMKSFDISYRSAGENIAMGQKTPEQVMTAWMNSEGHRANILNPSFTQIGIGYVADGNYWVQMFIS